MSIPGSIYLKWNIWPFLANFNCLEGEIADWLMSIRAYTCRLKKSLPPYLWLKKHGTLVCEVEKVTKAPWNYTFLYYFWHCWIKQSICDIIFKGKSIEVLSNRKYITEYAIMPEMVNILLLLLYYRVTHEEKIHSYVINFSAFFFFFLHVGLAL